MGKKATKITPQRVDLNELARLAESQAERNIAQSIALEDRYSPETALFRRQSLADLMNMDGQSPELQSMLQTLYGDFAAPDEQLALPELERSQLFDQAAQMALDDLELGGALDTETRNLVMREAAQRGSGAGFLGGVVGRDIGARDLGLTSLNLRNQRMDRAFNIGAAQQAENVQQQGLKNALNQANVALRQQGMANRAGLASFFQGLEQQDLANKMGLAQFGQAINRPIAGIDPGQLASAAVADINQLNQINAQNAASRDAARNATFQGILGLGGLGVGVAGLF